MFDATDRYLGYQCWQRFDRVTCGAQAGLNLDMERPCWEGIRVAQGARCTVRCALGYLPWPKISTCMSDGTLDSVGCYVTNPAGNFLMITVGSTFC